MMVTIEIPESVVDEAKARGISVEALVRAKIEVPSERPDLEKEGSDAPAITPLTSAEAGAGLREMRKRYTLGGTVTIEQLIEEGRRYWVSAIVLDASAALTCCFEDEAGPFSDRLTARMEAGEAVFVPAHWPVEFLSALQQGLRRKRIDEAGLADSLRFFASFSIRIDPPHPVTALLALRALCRKHDLSAYDAVYLAMAMRANVPLATIDEDSSRQVTRKAWSW